MSDGRPLAIQPLLTKFSASQKENQQRSESQRAVGKTCSARCNDERTHVVFLLNSDSHSWPLLSLPDTGWRSLNISLILSQNTLEYSWHLYCRCLRSAGITESVTKLLSDQRAGSFLLVSNWLVFRWSIYFLVPNLLLICWFQCFVPFYYIYLFFSLPQVVCRQISRPQITKMMYNVKKKRKKERKFARNSQLREVVKFWALCGWCHDGYIVITISLKWKVFTTLILTNLRRNVK